MPRALAVAALLAACGGGGKKVTNEPAKPATTAQEPLSNTQPAPAPAPAPASPEEKAMAAMTDFEAKMCACTTKDCMQKVSDEMSRWSQQVAKEQKEPVKLSEEQMQRMTALGTHMGECMQKLMGQP